MQHAAWVGAITAGGFIYIALADLLPELHREQRVHHSLLHVFVFLLGLGLMVGLTALE
jgi:zinc transporter ZupT